MNSCTAAGLKAHRIPSVEFGHHEFAPARHVRHLIEFLAERPRRVDANALGHPLGSRPGEIDLGGRTDPPADTNDMLLLEPIAPHRPTSIDADRAPQKSGGDIQD